MDYYKELEFAARGKTTITLEFDEPREIGAIMIYNSFDYEYAFSSKDLNMLEYLPDMMNLGIESYKIEGRMKSKEYVAEVTKTFRKLVDEYYNNKEPQLTKEDITNLQKTYNIQ